MSRRAELWSMFAMALIAVLPLLACKRRHRSPAWTPAPSAIASPAVAPLVEPSNAPSAATEPDEPGPEPVIDASHDSDKSLCVNAGKPAHALANDTPAQLLRAMRAALRSVSAVHVYGVAFTEIPKIQAWKFEVRASRELGLVYEAKTEERGKLEKVSIVQTRGGKTYARGKFLFSAHPDLAHIKLDRWFEVPEALLTVKPGEAQPDGPQGVFGMDIGYKAAIAAFAQDAISWYPDAQAEWLFQLANRRSPLTASKKSARVDGAHRYFAGCESVLVSRGRVDIQLSASSRPLPLQQDPEHGVISGRFRWGEYNRPFARQMAPAGAVALESLVEH